MIKLADFIYVLILVLITSACNSHPKANAARKNDEPVKAEQNMNGNIVVFGNSLTAGYGLDDPSDAFPSVLQRKIDSAHFPYKIVNAGVSGETTSGGNGRIDWILRQHMSVFILELGANDGLRGIPINETRKNLQHIIDKVKSTYPHAKIILAGMQVPPNMGQQYASDFRKTFSDLSRQNHVELIPFLLEGVGGVPNLNQRDGIHPNKEGARIVADNVWKVLKNDLEANP